MPSSLKAMLRLPMEFSTAERALSRGLHRDPHVLGSDGHHWGGKRGRHPRALRNQISQRSRISGLLSSAFQTELRGFELLPGGHMQYCCISLFLEYFRSQSTQIILKLLNPFRNPRCLLILLIPQPTNWNGHNAGIALVNIIIFKLKMGIIC